MGILGSGGIAHTMANTVKEMKDVELYAVGSRTLENAEKFAAEFGISKAYGSYEELAADPEVDLVYVANASFTSLSPCKASSGAWKACAL